MELAGLVRDQLLSGRTGIVLRRHDSQPEHWETRLRTHDGQASRMVNVKSDNLRRYDLPAAEVPSASERPSATPVVMRPPGELPSKAVIESHNLAHVPFADWCEIRVAAKGVSDPISTRRPSGGQSLWPRWTTSS